MLISYGADISRPGYGGNRFVPSAVVVADRLWVIWADAGLAWLTNFLAQLSFSYTSGSVTEHPRFRR